MDVKGAQHLEARIAEQAHWEQADAVRSGAQPPRDPDLAALRVMVMGSGSTGTRPSGAPTAPDRCW
jgi:hypothetical protein